LLLDPSDALSPGTQGFWLRVAASVVCGGAIGLERQFRGKVAGIRTSILICLGTEIFVALGASFPPEHSDPSRVLGQVVTGIGFLGAGVILARGDRILGVTTAAVIWTLSALGCLIGLGYLDAAYVMTLITLLVLIGVERIDQLVDRRNARRGSGTFMRRDGD
jgi:putative Mg2+ transporter-C (MgtC) family protein